MWWKLFPIDMSDFVGQRKIFDTERPPSNSPRCLGDSEAEFTAKIGDASAGDDTTTRSSRCELLPVSVDALPAVAAAAAFEVSIALRACGPSRRSMRERVRITRWGRVKVKRHSAWRETRATSRCSVNTSPGWRLKRKRRWRKWKGDYKNIHWNIFMIHLSQVFYKLDSKFRLVIDDTIAMG